MATVKDAIPKNGELVDFRCFNELEDWSKFKPSYPATLTPKKRLVSK